MRSTVLTILLFSLVLCACEVNDDSSGADYFILRGQLDNAANKQLYLQELTTTDLIPLDSLSTNASGSFSYRASLDEATYIILRADHDSYLTLVVEPGEEIMIRGDAQDLQGNHQINGSEGSELLSGFNSILARNHQRVDSLARILRGSKYQDNFMTLRLGIESAYRDILDEQRNEARKFIRENPRSLASIIVLYQFFGNQLLLSEEEHFDYFELLGQSLAEAYPTNRHVLDLNRRVNRYKRDEAQRRLARENLSTGSVAPEIVLPCPEGEMHSLSSLRGSYVLIDFWATWCTPCREANKHLRDLYDTYKDQGFEIYGVSLDRTRDQWLRGIEEDHITWIQVSDLRFWSSPVVSLYNVERIPFSVLVDPEGKVLYKGKDLERIRQILSSAFGA